MKFTEPTKFYRKSGMWDTQHRWLGEFSNTRYRDTLLPESVLNIHDRVPHVRRFCENWDSTNLHIVCPSGARDLPVIRTDLR